MFNTWFMATEFPASDGTDEKRASEILRSLDAELPGLRSADPGEQKRRGRKMLAEALLGGDPFHTEISDRLAKSEGLIRWLDSRVDGVSVPSTMRSKLAAGCLDMAKPGDV
jgi:hypothetical protein